MFKAKISLKT